MTRKPAGKKGFLTRLLHNEAGNVLAMTAAALIPLMGLVGGAIDMSRLYLTKTRLQQACDAGALAGRKAMGNGSWTTTTSGTQARANSMFDANFKTGNYGTGTSTRTFTEASGTVTGTVSAVVPMMIVKVLGFTSKTLNVTCTAKMEIPNTDVMFVLDVTGSMLDCPNGSRCYGGSGSKIAGLKSAVKCFYEALTQVNTSEVCGNDPTATTYSGTAQLRFGFVPYSVNVNIGKLLPNSYLADSWDYQSRETVPTGTATTSGDWAKISGTLNSNTNKRQDSCTESNNVTTVDGATTTTTSTDSMGGTVTTTTYTRTKNGTEVTCSKNGKSKWDITTDTYTNYKEQKTDVTAPTYAYQYHQRNFDVSGLKAGGSNWNNSINLDIGWMNASTSVTWEGCVEERYTVPNSDGDPSDEWNPLPSTAYDTDIDTVPSATSGTKWAPILESAVWRRYSGSDMTQSTTNYGSSANAPCPTQANKLQTWTPSPFVTYVNSLSPTGNTYHDIGLIWGARLMSPTGIFASENATTPGGQPIQRHLVFMTDGDTNVQLTDYSAYGINWWDRRQTTYEPSKSNLDDILDARVAGICAAIRNKNITVWVIAFGTDIATSTKTRLQNCASTPNGENVANTHYFNAADTATLQATFKSIAAQIANLRLTS